jgi:hypothetical protein
MDSASVHIEHFARLDYKYAGQCVEGRLYWLRRFQ